MSCRTRAAGSTAVCQARRMESTSGTADAGWSRRRFLKVGVGGAAALVVAGTAGVELVAHGVLPGKQTLDQLDGSCSVGGAPPHVAAVGPSTSGVFSSRARNCRVGYTIAYPPGHGRGSVLPLIVMLHGFGGDHTNALTGLSPAQAVALQVGGRPLAPMAMVTVDGGGGYWNPHPGDDPMGMVVDELLPMCQRLGLGAGPQRIGTMGVSMGGYGALRLAERYPGRFAAVAAISPAIWTSYDEAHGANSGAFASHESFLANDVIRHVGRLDGTPVRIASGADDPFHPGVEALAQVVPSSATVVVAAGCHTGPFFSSQQPPSLQFLSRHLTTPV